MYPFLGTFCLFPALVSSSQLFDAPGFSSPLFNFPPLNVGGGRAGPEIDFVSLFADYITPRGEGVSDACRNASQLYIDNINKFDGAALKMFDASAKLPPAGQLTNFILHHPGTFDSCLEVSIPEWKGQHCLLTSFAKGAGAMKRAPAGRVNNASRYHFDRMLGTKAPTARMEKLQKQVQAKDAEDDIMATLGQIFYTGAWKLGRCVPSVCTAEDVAQGLRNFMEEVFNPQLGPDFMESIDVLALNCHTADEEIPLEARDWGMIGVIAFFVVLVFIGTLIDIVLNILHLDDVFPDKAVQVFQGFSLYSNTLKLFHCPEPGNPGSLDCINGIRFLSMSWVLIGHGYSEFFGGPFTNNVMAFYMEVSGNGAFAAVANAFSSVDSFFLIGSTLLCFITLKELDKAKGGSAKFWIMYFVHRYIRLTGLYAIILGLHATLLKQFATGIQSNLLTSASTWCQDTWWTNFLYVNNLKWVNEAGLGCLGQTW